MLVIARKNIQTDQICRNETLDGKEYLVFPVVMMVEGVHINNAGATYYSAEQLAAIPEAWNLKPVVVLHPEEDGTPISACSKEVIEKQSIGVILNTFFDNGKLKTEAWIDINKAEKIQPGLISTLRSGTLMEVSIGHFSEDVEETGVWNNEEYSRKVTHIKPDHLALLPSQIGACSVADGAGIPRINRSFDLRVNEELSFDEIYKSINGALFAGVPPDKSRYLEAVYDDYLVYAESDFGSISPEVLYKCSYTINDGKVEFGATEQVRRVVEYIVNKETKTMDEKLKELLVNAGFSEESLTAFESLPEEDTKVLSTLFEKTPEMTKAPEIPEDKQISVNEYLQLIPEHFREVLSDGVRLLNNKRTDLVSVILANENNAFNKEELGGMSVCQLEKLARLAKKNDYSVAGSVVANRDITTEEPLEEPTFNMKGE